MSSFAPVDEQLAYIRKGAAEIIRESELREKLEKSRATGKPLRVKAGFDPTAPDLHLGHTVLIRKLKHFQDMGHTGIFLIGSAHRSDRRSHRPQCHAPAAFARRAECQRRDLQRSKSSKYSIVIRPKFVSIATGCSALGFEGLIRLAAKFTVSQMLEREDFHKRFQEEKPICSA